MLPVQVFFAKKNAEFFSIKRAAVSFLSEKTLGRNKETSCRDNSQTSPPQEIFIRAATKEMHHSPLLLAQKIPVLLSRSFSAARKSPFGSLRKKHLPANFATIKRGTPIFPANVAAKEGDTASLRKFLPQKGTALRIPSRTLPQKRRKRQTFPPDFFHRSI